MRHILEINTDEHEDVRKPRRIILHKEPMTQEVDSHTGKYVDAVQSPSPQQGDAIASDSEETNDGYIIARLMEARDAELRKILTSFLRKETVYVADNIIRTEPMYIYDLELPEEFNDANLQGLATLMHKYIVWGILFDWYAQMGAQEANVYAGQLSELEDNIKSTVSPAGYARRPLQPFGPAI